MILMFILAFIIVDLYVGLYSKAWLLDHRILAMLLVGVTPIALLYAIAHLLHKKGIVFRL
jgi:hypothetical protein